jgi:hypothetical protein
MITSEKDLNLKDFSLTPRKWMVAMFVVVLVSLMMNLLVLKQAWEYKTKWQNLNERLGNVESFLSQPPLETTKPK